MDRTMVERWLKQSEEHVALGVRQLVRQEQRIAKLRRDGHDTTAAEALLTEFEELQVLHTLHCDRLRRKLDSDRADTGAA